MSAGSGGLRSRIQSGEIVVAPGVSDPLQARLAERAGFPAIFASGSGIANSHLGVPDVGLVTMTEVVDVNRRIAAAVSIPVIADADTGYGNHLNVTRTVRELAHAGVAALFIEDQRAPKRCGHLGVRELVDVDEMEKKLLAARMARWDPELVLIARTDAISGEGCPAAISRARAYARAGADVVFVEGPRTREELESIPRQIDCPCMVSIVEGGVTPPATTVELEEMGYRVVLYPTLASRVGAHSVVNAFRTLREAGSSQSLLDCMLPWEETQRLVGLDEWLLLDARVSGDL